PAFGRSFDALVTLLAELGSADRPSAPATISVLSGDIHFSYHSVLHFPATTPVVSHVHQVVNSPIRNALRPFERTAMRVATSRVGALIARILRRATGGRRPTVRWDLDHGPIFENCVGVLSFDGDAATVCLERATVEDDGGAHRLEVVFDVDLRSC
ncbi:MAG TPA: hypothetical protein VNO51_03980, partial [Ilumatobacteraceae bacterium]|nr:hypothetical protein [Ilumatobacteraceae bacterium]